MNEGKEVSDNCCVDKLEKEEELGSCPTRCCKDASHSNTSCLGESIKTTLLFFVPNNKIVITAFYRFSFQKRGNA